ncbi:MAG TPA: aminotransferase class V-fold PLP-dependent enzyme, partial [Erythrobacter sp.]|nr:aminotransferase class V-fold PLP-dependent enzyme [Erythrobacter sp.]
ARERIKRSLGLGQGDKNYELIFTSGASEALWIALNRAKVSRRIVSAVEHDAVFRAAPDAEVVPIPLFGAEPDPEVLATALAGGGPAIFALQSLNSETGTQLLHSGWKHSLAIARQVRAASGLLLADCSQSAGKFRIPDADMIVVSAHKFGGPIGIGALLVRDFAMLEPGGGHERGYRQGTENLPGALGMAAALEAGGLDSWATSEGERLDFRQAIWAAGEGTVMGPQCSHIFAVAHPTLSAQALLIRLDAMGFAVSAGSACSSGTLKKSRVLDAFGVPDDVAARTIRVSLGWSTTPEELERFSEAWVSVC